MFLFLHEFISSVLLLMQFVPDSSINKASFKHNLHVIVPGLDIFTFVVFSNLYCSSCFYFLICWLILKVHLLVCTGCIFFRLVCSLLLYCVFIYAFLADWHLVQCILMMNCLFYIVYWTTKKKLKIIGPRTLCTKNLLVIESHTTDTF